MTKEGKLHVICLDLTEQKIKLFFLRICTILCNLVKNDFLNIPINISIT